MSPTDLDHYQGCLLALALADASGAPYEGGWLERGLWRCIGRTADGLPRWTDDTQMALDVADGLLRDGAVNQDALARQFAASYHWSRGYGPGAARLLKRVRHGQAWQSARRAVFQDGSLGNGAAMRTPPIALRFHTDVPRLLAQTRLAAEITHAHPWAIEGAQAIALATRAALRGDAVGALIPALRQAAPSPIWADKINTLSDWLGQQASPTAPQVADRLGNGITAPDSVITAIYVAYRCIDAPFAQLLDFVQALHGDVDTLGAMAGAIWGARNGAATLLDRPLEQKARILTTAERLYRAAIA